MKEAIIITVILIFFIYFPFYLNKNEYELKDEYIEYEPNLGFKFINYKNKTNGKFKKYQRKSFKDNKVSEIQ